MKKQNWVWMAHAGHFILGHMCRFKLNTYVGKYIVSTVGEYVPDSQVRAIHVRCNKDSPLPQGDAGEYEYLKRYGYEKLGAGDRIYETMVFKASKTKDKCCPYHIIVSKEVDFAGYTKADDAYEGHMRMCNKWSKK
jgi:hypothetical protein